MFNQPLSLTSTSSSGSTSSNNNNNNDLLIISGRGISIGLDLFADKLSNIFLFFEEYVPVCVCVTFGDVRKKSVNELSLVHSRECMMKEEKFDLE